MNNIFDVIIIGGGINGAAIARDAALRGLKVALFEKKDFGSGTTQYSTRLIHGGLRYLEQFQIGLVYEALHERETLFQIAPHLTRPLQFIIPGYDHSTRPRWYIEAGVLFYDLLSFCKSVPRHTILRSKTKVLELEKWLQQKGLKGGVAYFDGQVNFPERLCLAHVKDAARHKALVQNYVEAKEILRDDGKVKGVNVRNLKTGKMMMFQAPIVVNASGPWVDETNALLKDHLPKEIGGTKGSHIVVKLWRDAPVHALYVETRLDKRPVFIVPWRGYILIGTTDIPYDKNVDIVHPTVMEAQYLIDETNWLFPKAQLSLKKIIHCYAGVRPLHVIRKEKPGDIPRKHIIRDYASMGIEGYFSIISGKITTHRRLAEETVDLVMDRLRRKGNCVTAKIATFGGNIEDIDRYIQENLVTTKKIGLTEEQVKYLIAMFGSQYEQILNLIKRNKKLKEKISKYHPDVMAEIVYCLEEEYVIALADFLQRRTGIGSGEGQGLDCVEKVAMVFARHFNWSTRKMLQEVEKYKKEVKMLYTLHKH